MKNKRKRLQLIEELLRTNVVSSQELLSNLLVQRDCSVTQATLSRDLKQLKVAKTHLVDGTYKYTLPVENKEELKEGRFNSFAKGVIQQIDFSGSLIVLKTKPGYASAVAWDIDNEARPEIIGSIAGDDTVLIIIREGVAPKEVLSRLSFVRSEKG